MWCKFCLFTVLFFILSNRFNWLEMCFTSWLIDFPYRIQYFFGPVSKHYQIRSTSWVYASLNCFVCDICWLCLTANLFSSADLHPNLSGAGRAAKPEASSFGNIKVFKVAAVSTVTSSTNFKASCTVSFDPWICSQRMPSITTLLKQFLSPSWPALLFTVLFSQK